MHAYQVKVNDKIENFMEIKLRITESKFSISIIILLSI